MMSPISSQKRTWSFPRRVQLLAAHIPARLWFRSVLVFSSLRGRVAGVTGHNRRLSTLLVRDQWLRELSSHGPFPIPQRVHGMQELEGYSSQGPVIYCSTHLAGFEICLRALVEMGQSPIAVADDGRIGLGLRYSVIGLQAKLPALRAVTPYTLTQMRRLLIQGRSIACMADKAYLDSDLSSNCLRLAGRMGVPVIFTWAKLGVDGAYDVIFRPLPHPYCESEAAIEANMVLLRGLHRSIRASVGLAEETAVIPMSGANPLVDKPRHSEAA